jgi:hypothetical protein
MPAAVQRSTICPSRRRVTLRLVLRAIEIIDLIGLLVVSFLASNFRAAWLRWMNPVLAGCEA